MRHPDPTLLAIAALAMASPALARERQPAVQVSTTRLDQAILAIGRQTGTSIGLRDQRLAGMRVHALSGNLSAHQALVRLLRGTGARIRQTGPGTFLIEAAPKPVRPMTTVRQRLSPAPVQPAREIIVTATKRAIPLSDYDGSATIISGDSLNFADSARGTDAILTKSASLSSTHLGPGRNKLFIRGIADSSFTGPTQSTVGEYWGDMRITYSAPDPDLRLYDVKRVEVLQGPQGTLYGAGALGGIVRIVPRPPDLDHSGGQGWTGASFTQHGAPGGDGGAIVNLPIVEDRLAVRAVGYAGIDGGYIDDPLRGKHDVNQVRTVGGRASLRFDPVPDWSITLEGTFQHIRGRDAQYADRDGDGLSRASGLAQPYRNDYASGSITISGEIGSAQLTSTTGIVDQYLTERFDATTTLNGEALKTPHLSFAALALSAYDESQRIHLVNSETRLSHSNDDGSGWVVGINGMTAISRVHRNVTDDSRVAPLAGIRNRVDEVTLYAQASAAPFDGLLITGGGRLTWTRLSGQAQDIQPVFALRIDPDAQASRTETRALPSFGLHYRLVQGMSVFARYAEGYRPGGLALHRDYVQRFRGDRVGTWEAGMRWQGGDHAPFDISASIALTRWDDIQADIINGLGFPATANIGNGRVHSLGVAASWRPVSGLTVGGALYLNDSKVTIPDPLLMSVLITDISRSSTLPNVADVSGTTHIEYSRAMGNGRTLQVSGYGRYMGKSVLGVGPGLSQPQGNYFDTGVDIRFGTQRWGVSASLTNLFDSRGNRFALGSPFQVRDGDQITPLRPRTLRIGTDISF
ncbi:TonB-dependent receptor [Stakelama sediminis]